MKPKTIERLPKLSTYAFDKSRFTDRMTSRTLSRASKRTDRRRYLVLLALPQLMADLVRLNVDVLVVGFNPVAIAARQATSTIPIVAADRHGSNQCRAC
jgi:hypothetical protein